MTQTDVTIRFFDGKVDFDGMNELGKVFEKIIADFSGRNDISITTELEDVDGDPLYIFEIRHKDDDDNKVLFWEKADKDTLNTIKRF